MSNSGGGQGFLTRQISSKAHISHARQIGEVWIFPSSYPRLTGFRFGKNLNHHFSAEQSVQDNVEVAIYRFICTSINPDCVQPSQFNCDGLLGKLLALKVIPNTIYCQCECTWHKVSLRRTGRHTLFEKTEHFLPSNTCFLPIQVHLLSLYLLRLLELFI